MANIRKKKSSKYTPLSNSLLQDRSLSFGCRGMLGYLLSKPEGWETKPSDIEREGGIGRDARRSLMVEAEKAGYLTFRSGREKGRFASWYDAHEEPVPQEERTRSWEMGGDPAKKGRKKPGKTDTENPQLPDTGNPSPADSPPDTENPCPVNADNPQSPNTGQPEAVQPPRGSTAGGQPVTLINKEIEKTEIENTEGEKTEGARAVKIFEEVFGFTPSIIQQERMEVVLDFSAWARTLQDWKLNGYSQRNVSGMIESYQSNAVKLAKLNGNAHVGAYVPRPSVPERAEFLDEATRQLSGSEESQALTQKLISSLDGKVGDQALETWFRPLRILDLKSGVLRILAPSWIFEDWILNNYREAFSDALDCAGFEVEAVEFISRNGDRELRGVPPAGT